MQLGLPVRNGVVGLYTEHALEHHLYALPRRKVDNRPQDVLGAQVAGRHQHIGPVHVGKGRRMGGRVKMVEANRLGAFQGGRMARGRPDLLPLGHQPGHHMPAHRSGRTQHENLS